MSKIFAEVPFHKISGFYYTQNIQLFGMKKQKELHHIRPGEMKKILGGGYELWMLSAPWLADERHFSFQIV